MEAILKNGLIPGGTAKDSRNENHFTPVEAWDKETPGYRYESDITFYFNLTAMIRDGFEFWWTKSGAIVSTAVIPPKYMLKVAVNKTREVRWVSPRIPPPRTRGETPVVSPDVTTRGETLAASSEAIEEQKKKTPKLKQGPKAPVNPPPHAPMPTRAPPPLPEEPPVVKVSLEEDEEEMKQLPKETVSAACPAATAAESQEARGGNPC